MKKKQISCACCEGEFTIAHNMDPDHYTISYCPFCGEYLGDEDRELSFEDGEDEWLDL